MSVFRGECPVTGSARVYDGWRLGIRGRGGAGARGYLVIAEGEVGDLAAAAKASTEGGETPPEPSDCVAGELGSLVLPDLYLRMDSSLCSFIRMERRAGAISSVVFAFGERRLLELCFELASLCRSDSDSEDRPEDEEVCFDSSAGFSFERQPEGVFSSDKGTDSRFCASFVIGSTPFSPLQNQRPSRCIW